MAFYIGDDENEDMEIADEDDGYDDQYMHHAYHGFYTQRGHYYEYRSNKYPPKIYEENDEAVFKAAEVLHKPQRYAEIPELHPLRAELHWKLHSHFYSSQPHKPLGLVLYGCKRSGRSNLLHNVIEEWGTFNKPAFYKLLASEIIQFNAFDFSNFDEYEKNIPKVILVENAEELFDNDRKETIQALQQLNENLDMLSLDNIPVLVVLETSAPWDIYRDPISAHFNRMLYVPMLEQVKKTQYRKSSDWFDQTLKDKFETFNDTNKMLIGEQNADAELEWQGPSSLAS